MNNRFLTIAPLLASSTLFLPGCSEDNSSFETPNLSDAPTNSGIVSQKNFSILAEDTQPTVFDPATGTATDTSLVITVKVGDRDNQLLTDSHTVFFATEWGLIEPSCVTENGTCTVTWQTSFGVNNGAPTAPADLLNTITAWTLGEENFSDTNGDGIFNDPESVFDDREEPYVDADTTDGAFNAGAGDRIIDVPNGNDVTGANGVHDTGDTFLNSPSCQHTSLCSTVMNTTYIWVDIVLKMDGPPTTP
jgi:hypothetical protein